MKCFDSGDSHESGCEVALQTALRQRSGSLRRIADKLINRAGDLPFVHELVDRLDGSPPQSFDRLAELTDAELLLIAAGGRIEDELEMKVIPPPSKD
jgi:hypothetical protein